FNVPQVIQNAANLLVDNGHLLIVANSNGFLKHGFYQFSPEFFYRAFSKQNGFKRTAVFIVDLDNQQRWYHVRNPAVTGVRSRCGSVGLGRTYVVCAAQKLSSAGRLNVQQADYEQSVWRAPEPAAHRPRAPQRSTLARRARNAVVRVLEAFPARRT